ncbi:MAG: isochorismatase family protein [Geodermatophilaceae bacterium]|nr:isochorismatase family protein [Geodermatophilaceae bacterium]
MAGQSAEHGRRLLEHREFIAVDLAADRLGQPVDASRSLAFEHFPSDLGDRQLCDAAVGWITSLPTIHPADEVVSRAAHLAQVFRARGLPVTLVRVAFASDGGDTVAVPVDEQPPRMDLGPNFATYRSEIGTGPTDIEITKRGWDGFFGTELDLQLRRRGVRCIVLAGIRTAIAVESTARTGFALNYAQVVAGDAISDTSAEAHDNSVRRVLPRLSRLATTEAIIGALST